MHIDILNVQGTNEPKIEPERKPPVFPTVPISGYATKTELIAQAQSLAAAQQSAEIAKTASETSTEGENALGAVMRQAGLG